MHISQLFSKIIVKYAYQVRIIERNVKKGKLKHQTSKNCFKRLKLALSDCENKFKASKVQISNMKKNTYIF